MQHLLAMFTAMANSCLAKLCLANMILMPHAAVHEPSNTGTHSASGPHCVLSADSHQQCAAAQAHTQQEHSLSEQWHLQSANMYQYDCKIARREQCRLARNLTQQNRSVGCRCERHSSIFAVSLNASWQKGSQQLLPVCQIRAVLQSCRP